MRVLFVMLIFGVFGCRTNSNSNRDNELTTTSDKLKEFSYEIDGTISLPLGRESYEIAFLVDQIREKLDHSGISRHEDAFASLIKSEESFRSAFEAAYSDRYPLLFEDGEVDQSKILYWVSRQVQFTKHEAKAHHVSLTVKSVKEVKKLSASNASTLVLSYKARILGVNEISDRGAALDKSPIAEDARFRVLSNPIDSYFATMGKESIRAFDRAKNEIRAGRLKEVLKGADLVDLVTETKDNAMGSPCYKADGDHLGPFNLFYYFDPRLPGCSDKVEPVSLTVTRVSAIDVATTFPEFHRIFEDKKVDIFVYYNTVDGEEKVASKLLIEKLQGQGYELASKSDDKALIRLTAKRKGIQLNIGISVGYPGREAFRKAIQTDEIVIYDGHAGYGSNIDSNFTRQSSLPKGKYQIFVLNGCSTYKYGVTQILDAKVLKDFDFHNHNADVITTYDDVRGHRQNDVMIEKIHAAIPFYVDGKWTAETKAKFQQELSWLAIVTEINKVSDEYVKNNGIFMVSGEIDNDYVPGKTAFTSTNDYKPSELLAMVSDQSAKESLRTIALRAYMKTKTESVRNGRVEDIVGELSDFCNKNKRGSTAVFATNFHLPSCQARQMIFHPDSKLTLMGSTIDPDIGLTFHPNGNPRRVRFRQNKTIQGFPVKGEETVLFHDNGLPQAFKPHADFTHSNGLRIASGFQVFLYPSGELYRAYSLQPVVDHGFKFTGSLKLHENGSVMSGSTTIDQPLYGVMAKDVVTLDYYAGGTLKGVDGAIEMRKDKIHLTGRCTVSFHTSGKVRRVSCYSNPGEERSVLTYRGEEYRELFFRPNGSRAMGAVSEPIPLDSALPCLFAPDSGNFFWDENDKLSGCGLASDFTQNGTTFPSGSIVWRGTDGRYQRVNETEAGFRRLVVDLGIEWMVAENFDDPYARLWGEMED